MTIHYCAKCARTVPAEEAVNVARVLPLTRKQRAIYDYLEGFDRMHGYAPSFEEIATRFGYKSLSTVHEHVTNLQRKGWIRREYNAARSLQCVGPER